MIDRFKECVSDLNIPKGLTQEQLMILAFGEEFMASDDKGTLKKYRGMVK